MLDDVFAGVAVVAVVAVKAVVVSDIREEKMLYKQINTRWWSYWSG